MPHHQNKAYSLHCIKAVNASIYKQRYAAVRKCSETCYKIGNWVHMSYANCLQAINLPSLVCHRYRGDMIEVYKYLHGMYSVPCNSLLTKALPSALKGHDHKLFKRHCHSQLRLQFFSLRVSNLYNCLPEDAVSAPSLNAFKERLDKFWAEILTESRDIFKKLITNQP